MLGTMKYWDRGHAGRQLSRALRRFSIAEPLLLAAGPESVLIARQVSDRLQCDIDVLLVADVCDSEEPQVVFGAVTEGGATVIDRTTCAARRIDAATIEAAIHRGLSEAARRATIIRGGNMLTDLRGRFVIIVDDRMASAMRMSAAVSAARRRGAERVVVAAPIGARTAVENLQIVADEVICPLVVSDEHPVTDWYQEPETVTDTDVAAMLRMAARHEVSIEVGDPHGRGWQVQGTLAIPRGARGVVVFAHGSGSSRWSPRNQEVADSLNDAGFATVLFDLLTEDEAADRSLVFDIPYLAERLIAVVDWCRSDDRLRHLPMGLFGASTGAAAALAAAARRPEVVRAVVSRGGRPDLAMEDLPHVDAPTLLIVGGDDEQVLRLNEAALGRLSGMARIEVVPGATHLFEEPGALERVSLLAGSWFDEFFAASERATGSLIRYRRTS